MGKKTNPIIFRMGITTGWNSTWFARGKDYARQLHEDLLIRKFLKDKLRDASIGQVKIERSPRALTVILNTAKPGIVIGRGGSGVDDLKKKLQKDILKDKKKVNLQITIKEITKPMLSSAVVAQNVVSELERRVPYRRVMRRIIDQVMKNNAQGVKIILSGRLDGVEIARRETLSKGKIPLHTLRADIDYYRTAARTIYGSVGVKVWIYKGEVFDTGDKN